MAAISKHVISGKSTLFQQFERIRTFAQTGLNHSNNLPSHHAIYSEIISTCKEIALSASTECELLKWDSILLELGCITPKVGAVVGILRTDGHLLVLQRTSGRWCLPCGYADIGESPEETAWRETREETGLDITQINLLKVTTTKGDDSVPFMWETVFIARAISDEITLSHEHIGAEWIPCVDDRDWHSTHQLHASMVLGAEANSSAPSLERY